MRWPPFSFLPRSWHFAWVVGWCDLCDVILMTFLLYQTYIRFRGTQAARIGAGLAVLGGSNSQFEFLGGVERRMVVEALMHEGEEVHPTGKTQIARERAQIIKEGLTAH
jgi:hypothetical protein